MRTALTQHAAEAAAAAALRRQAIVATLDDDLDQLNALLATPLAAASLSPRKWKAAEDARAKVEQSVRSMATRAHQRAISAEAEHSVAEIANVRKFLDDWDARVRRAG
jgi:hypothetical protein